MKREWARAEEKETSPTPEPEFKDNGKEIPTLQDQFAALFLEFGREAALASSFEGILELVDRADDYVERILRAQEE